MCAGSVCTCGLVSRPTSAAFHTLAGLVGGSVFLNVLKCCPGLGHEHRSRPTSLFRASQHVSALVSIRRRSDTQKTTVPDRRSAHFSRVRMAFGHILSRCPGVSVISGGFLHHHEHRETVWCVRSVVAISPRSAQIFRARLIAFFNELPDKKSASSGVRNALCLPSGFMSSRTVVGLLPRWASTTLALQSMSAAEFSLGPHGGSFVALVLVVLGAIESGPHFLDLSLV